MVGYTKVEFEDYPSKKTPTSAANLNHMDDGIYNNAVKIAANEEAIAANNEAIANMETSISDLSSNLQEIGTETELWNGTISRGTITLSKSIKNFKRLEFIMTSYQASLYYGGTKEITVSSLEWLSKNTGNGCMMMMNSSTYFQVKIVDDITLSITSPSSNTDYLCKVTGIK